MHDSLKGIDMSNRAKILVVGSFVMDLIVSTRRVPNDGETVVDGLAFNTAAGGKGLNQASQAALLGSEVHMLGCVGQDAFGDQMVKALKRVGVQTEHVLRAREGISSGVGNIILETKPGEKVRNRIIVVPGANHEITAEDVAFLKEDIAQYDMVMLQLEIPMAINEIVTQYAFDKGVPVMLNSAPSAPLSSELLSRLSFISPNEHEAKDITGIEIKKIDGQLDMDSVKAAATKLMDMGVKNVIITLGSHGAAFMNAENFIHKDTIDIVDVVDPTAAGDSFVGSFCSKVASGMSYDEALSYANYAASVTVSRMGAQPSLPNEDEVAALIQRHQEILAEV